MDNPFTEDTLSFDVKCHQVQSSMLLELSTDLLTCTLEAAAANEASASRAARIHQAGFTYHCHDLGRCRPISLLTCHPSRTAWARTLQKHHCWRTDSNNRRGAQGECFGSAVLLLPAYLPLSLCRHRSRKSLGVQCCCCLLTFHSVCADTAAGSALGVQCCCCLLTIHSVCADPAAGSALGVQCCCCLPTFHSVCPPTCWQAHAIARSCCNRASGSTGPGNIRPGLYLHVCWTRVPCFQLQRREGGCSNCCQAAACCLSVRSCSESALRCLQAHILTSRQVLGAAVRLSVAEGLLPARPAWALVAHSVVSSLYRSSMAVLLWEGRCLPAWSPAAVNPAAATARPVNRCHCSSAPALHTELQRLCCCRAPHRA